MGKKEGAATHKGRPPRRWLRRGAAIVERPLMHEATIRKNLTSQPVERKKTADTGTASGKE